MNCKIAYPHFALFLFLMLCGIISAYADKVDDYVRAQMRERHVPGAAIAVVKNGRVVKAVG